MSDPRRAEPAREVSPVIGLMVVSYVERALGAQVADLVVETLGTGETVGELRDRDRWYSVDELVRMAGTAAELTHDLEFGRRIGEELFRFCLESGFVDWLRAAGTVADATLVALEFGSKMGSGRLLAPIEHGDNAFVFSGTFAAVEESTLRNGGRIFCDLLAGFYAQVPSIFGFLGTAVETRCQLEGHHRCEFRMAWRPDPTVHSPGEVDVATSVARTRGMIEQYEELHSMARDLVAVDDVDGVLERIIGHVSHALPAPQYLLAVDAGDGRLRVHSVGFTPEQANELAVTLIEADAPASASIAVAPVRCGDRVVGRLAAVFSDGASTTEIDDRLLNAYAGHAGAALNVISSLQVARRDRDTAQVLLTLARSLAEVASSAEIAIRIADAVPQVVGASCSSVALYDPDAQRLALTAVAPAMRDIDLAQDLDVDAVPGLAAFASDPRPLLLRVQDVPPSLRGVFDAYGVAAVAIAPILSRGEFLGIVTAGFDDDRDSDVDGELLDRLAGLADHAATALENAELLDRLRHETLHDGITGLPNRLLVEDRGRIAFASAARIGTKVGLLFVDLDRFKNVNDTLGHNAGDELIGAVADRLHLQMRDGDTLARLGGDEFVVLLPHVGGPDDCVVVANRIIDTLREPFEIGGQELFISCSIGVACSPDHGDSYESLLQYADSAMYTAKNRGRGTCAVDAAAIATPRRRQLRLESQLHRALEHDELRVHYQPLVELGTNRIVGAEALVRWQHAEQGLLLPGAFLPLAEESGLVAVLDEWVRVEAFAQLRRWRDAGRDLLLSVNVDGRSLANPRLAATIAAELAAAGADPGFVELEINENVALSDVDELPQALAPLRALGVGIAIDDFGTGSSVLRRLQHCEIDTLKIDRSFIAGVTDDSFEAPLVRALVAMARSLELSVVAEGVETAAQATLLERYGCDLAQGWLFGKAVSADEFERTLPEPVATATAATRG